MRPVFVNNPSMNMCWIELSLSTNTGYGGIVGLASQVQKWRVIVLSCSLVEPLPFLVYLWVAMYLSTVPCIPIPT